ncbi:MAG: N-acetyltransferase [Acidobacteria bacterium]|nr:MAG: N-acetyltransferase [Acidobacteriota bacterium]
MRRSTPRWRGSLRLGGSARHLWGQGYAAEIARAVIDYCFGSLVMPVIRASTDTGNRASARVLEKLGFCVVDRRTVGGLDTLFYELAREADLQP